MAAPSATTRQTPSGIKLDDGYQSLITFESDPDVSFWEKSVTPPSIDGGEPIDTTTMHNSTFRTKASRSLKEYGDCTLVAAYDPVCYTQCLALCNVETIITVTFPDGSTLAFHGYLQKFEPNALEEGSQPEATITIVATNQDSSGTEQAPVLDEVAGT